MKSRTAKWFETSIRYDKTMEDGMPKKVTELYVVDALSFGEAEETITKEMSAYISGEFEVKMPTTTVGTRHAYRSSPSTRRRRRRNARRSPIWCRLQRSTVP